MTQFTLNISGYCKYITYGVIKKELHFFWKANKPESVKAQLFPGAYIPPENVIPITDKSNPLFLNVWKHYNNILEVSGLYPGMIHAIVKNSDQNIIWSSDNFDDPDVTDTFNNEADIPPGLYLNTWRHRKGDYGTAVITDMSFCPEKLSYSYIVVNGEALIYRFFYDGVELDISEGLLGDIDLGYKFLKIK